MTPKIENNQIKPSRKIHKVCSQKTINQNKLKFKKIINQVSKSMKRKKSKWMMNMLQILMKSKSNSATTKKEKMKKMTQAMKKM